jgi:hypothetical protein
VAKNRAPTGARFIFLRRSRRTEQRFPVHPIEARVVHQQQVGIAAARYQAPCRCLEQQHGPIFRFSL